jgi:hypothetical protein
MSTVTNGAIPRAPHQEVTQQQRDIVNELARGIIEGRSLKETTGSVAQKLFKQSPPVALVRLGFWGFKRIRSFGAAHIGSKKEAFKNAKIVDFVVSNREEYNKALNKKVKEAFFQTLFPIVHRLFTLDSKPTKKQRKEVVAQVLRDLKITSVGEVKEELRVYLTKYLKDGDANLEQAGRALFKQAGMKPSLCPCTADQILDFLEDLNRAVNVVEENDNASGADATPSFREDRPATSLVDAVPEQDAARSGAFTPVFSRSASAPPSATPGSDPREPEAALEPARAESAPLTRADVLVEAGAASAGAPTIAEVLAEDEARAAKVLADAVAPVPAEEVSVNADSNAPVELQETAITLELIPEDDENSAGDGGLSEVVV